MRKISLLPYKTRDNQDYDVRASILNLLFSDHLRLNARGIFENEKIAQKIEPANDQVLLEETEYQILKNAVETFEGYNRQDLEFIRRITEAPEVPVTEAI